MEPQAQFLVEPLIQVMLEPLKQDPPEPLKILYDSRDITPQNNIIMRHNRYAITISRKVQLETIYIFKLELKFGWSLTKTRH